MESAGHNLQSGQRNEGSKSLAQIKDRRMTLKGSFSAVAKVHKKLVFQQQAIRGLETKK